MVKPLIIAICLEDSRELTTTAEVAVAGHAQVVRAAAPATPPVAAVLPVQRTVFQGVVQAAQVVAVPAQEGVQVTARVVVQAVAPEHVRVHVEVDVSNRVLEDKK